MSESNTAPMGQELPALPEPYTKVIDHNNGAGESTVDAWIELYDGLYTAEQVRQAQRAAIAADRVARAQQQAQSIGNDPKFRELVEFWSGKYHSALAPIRAGHKEAWGALIAYIDGRIAGAVPADRMVRDLVALWDSTTMSADDYNEAMCAIEDRMRAYAAAPSPQHGKEGGNEN